MDELFTLEGGKVDSILEILEKRHMPFPSRRHILLQTFDRTVHGLHDTSTRDANVSTSRITLVARHVEKEERKGLVWRIGRRGRV